MTRLCGSRVCVGALPALAMHSWAQMSPLPPPADQLPDQALSERSPLERVTSKSPFSVQRRLSPRKCPASKQGGAGSEGACGFGGAELCVWDRLPALASGQAPPRTKLQGQTSQDSARGVEHRGPRQMAVGQRSWERARGGQFSLSRLSEQAGQRGGRAGGGRLLGHRQSEVHTGDSTLLRRLTSGPSLH